MGQTKLHVCCSYAYKKYLMKIQMVIFFMSLIALISCTVNDQQKVPQMDFASMESLLQKDNDTVYVINFWATWCKPCIDELPEFEKINREYHDKNVSVILVSLDFPSNYHKLLLPYIEEHNIQSKVIHLTEVNANNWIDKVDPKWSGSIPATLIYNGNSREFFEGKLNYNELKQRIELKL